MAKAGNKKESVLLRRHGSGHGMGVGVEVGMPREVGMAWPCMHQTPSLGPYEGTQKCKPRHGFYVL